MHASSASFPRAGCLRCLDEAWVECGACGRWYCGPCSRSRNSGTIACANCHPTPRSEPDGGHP